MYLNIPILRSVLLIFDAWEFSLTPYIHSAAAMESSTITVDDEGDGILEGN